MIQQDVLHNISIRKFRDMFPEMPGKELKKLQQTDAHIADVRGEGLMIGIEYDQPIKALRNALVHDEHVFTGAASTNILRLLPPLTLSLDEAKLAVEHIKQVSKVLG